MHDRFGIGEVLAGVGAVGLTLLLAFGDWFEVTTTVRFPTAVSRTAGFGASELGWFAFGVTILAAVAGLIFLLRVVTAPTTERVMLQGPVAWTAAVFALLVVLVRMLLFMPDFDGTVKLGSVDIVTIDTGVALGGWLGLLALLLLVIGTWLSFSDTRDNTPAAIAQTEALLAEAPVRPAPPADGAQQTATTEPSDSTTEPQPADGEPSA